MPITPNYYKEEYPTEKQLAIFFWIIIMLLILVIGGFMIYIALT